ncbi:MAG: vitamin B12-dependent ribonucleotide reductase [Dehalococcoidia bacterium]
MAQRPRGIVPPWLSTAGSLKARSGFGASASKRRPAARPPSPPKRAAKPAAPPPRRARGHSVDLSANARTVLERRYLAQDERGRIAETPEQLFRRVAHNIALAEAAFTPPARAAAAVADAEAQFYALMTSLRFLPNSPTLGNAGRPLQQLSACFVLPVEDSMDGIFESLKHTALIHQSGGGTGFAFSRLRPAGDRVASTGGVASGPVSFMRVYDAATESIKQGGTRRGANMAILSVDHPDIDAFIAAKAGMTALQNFNISVAVTERFMQAVERDEPYQLLNPRTSKSAGKLRAREVFRRIVENAWTNGDPGLVFLDRVNRDNPTPHLGRIEATNPCGEQPLLPYESCNLGSLNLAKFVRETAAPSRPKPSRNGSDPRQVEIDWDALGEAIPLCVRFLDDVIEQNRYPIPQIDEMTKQTRKIGLGVMGWADLLFQLRVPYDSDEAVELGARVMALVQEHADRASEALATERGVFPAWHGSIYDPASGDRRGGPRYRNSTRTTVAPTGTLSIIADCSGGIEPAFALAFMRQHYLDRKDPSRPVQLTEVNPAFRDAARQEGFVSDDLIAHLTRGGSLRDRREVPEWAKRVFVTSHDIDPSWHVRMQAAFQRHTDNAVSKTINFRRDATVEDVERAYLLAYREGCKGITIYRDGSREHQVLSHATARGPEQAEAVAAEVALGVRELIAAQPHPAATGSTEPRPSGAPYRRHLPDERRSVTHKFRVGEQEGYLTVGLYDDGAPGEIFVNISKEGSTIRGLMDSVALLTSVALQYGVPLGNLVAKFRGVHFEPAGLTANPRIPTASSIVDYIFRWLEQRFLNTTSQPDDTPRRKKPRAGTASKRRASPAKPGAKRAKTAPAPKRSAPPKKPPTRAPRASILHPPASRRPTSPRTPASNRASSPQPPASSRPAARAAAPDTSTGIACPECGAILVFAEGCMVCRSCGYTRC